MKKFAAFILFLSCYVYSQNVGIGTPVPGAKLEIYKNTTTTNTVEEMLRISHETSGTPASGIGSAITFHLQGQNDPALSEWMRMEAKVINYFGDDFGTITFQGKEISSLGSTYITDPVRIWANRGVQISSIKGVSWGWPNNRASYNSLEIREPSQASIELFSIVNQTSIVDAWAATLFLNSSKGTPSSYTPVQTGDYLGRVIFTSNGYYGSAIKSVSTLDWSGLGTSTSTIGADLRFYTKRVVGSTGAPTEKLRINDNGEIYVFTDGAEGGQIKFFEHNNTANYFYIDYEGGNARFIFSNSISGCGFPECNVFYIDGNGPVFAKQLNAGTGTNLVIDGTTGEIKKQTSSMRFKANIQDFSDDWTKILELQPKEFDYIDSGDHSIGYIAEELHELGLNNLLEYDKEGKPYSIHFDRLTLYLLEVVKQQQKTIEELQQKIK